MNIPGYDAWRRQGLREEENPVMIDARNAGVPA